MKALKTHLDDYLKLRRQLGFKLREAGGLLRRFVQFAQAENASFITTKLALRWATQPTNVQSSQWANRLGMVRRFARYLSAVDPRTEIPPPGLLPHRYHRKAPYVYRDQEVVRLIGAARKRKSSADGPSQATPP